MLLSGQVRLVTLAESRAGGMLDKKQVLTSQDNLVSKSYFKNRKLFTVVEMLLTSLAAFGSDTHEKVMSHMEATSAGVRPNLAPSCMNRSH